MIGNSLRKWDGAMILSVSRSVYCCRVGALYFQARMQFGIGLYVSGND